MISLKQNTIFFSAICLAAGMLFAAPAFAGDGHDHGDSGPAANANGPQRQPDGSVFLPKPAQRQLGIRTLVVALGFGEAALGTLIIIKHPNP